MVLLGPFDTVTRPPSAVRTEVSRRPPPACPSQHQSDSEPEEEHSLGGEGSDGQDGVDCSDAYGSERPTVVDSVCQDGVSLRANSGTLGEHDEVAWMIFEGGT